MWARPGKIITIYTAIVWPLLLKILQTLQLMSSTSETASDSGTEQGIMNFYWASDHQPPVPPFLPFFLVVDIKQHPFVYLLFCS